MDKIYYYQDELNDDFAGTNIKQKKVNSNHHFISKNPIWNFFAFILYRIIVEPIVWCFQKIYYGEKIVNRKILRRHRKTGYFLYANHTLACGDAFTPSMVTHPKKSYILVNPDATSIPIIGGIVEMLGGMPIPNDFSGLKNFNEAIQERVRRNNVIVIYPEAHIWPYYTGIRNFRDVSFKYPIKYDKPVFCFTRTFQKRFIGSRPKSVVYIDGPFYADKNLSMTENQRKLRDEVYTAMCARSQMSTVEYVKYIKYKTPTIAPLLTTDNLSCDASVPQNESVSAN